MRIGIHSFSARPSLEQQLQQVADADRDGFDSYWFGQAFGLDALTLAAIAGRNTSRIELGTAVAVTYSRHPFAMALQALTVQAATNGRFTLGVGPSHKPLIQDMWGLPYEQVALRVREYLSVLRPLVSEGRVAFSGTQFRVSGAHQMPEVKPCPILISALAPMMLRTAGEIADGTVTWMAGPKTVEKHVVPRINAAAEAAGRPRPRICVCLPVAVADDVEEARQRAARAFQIYGHLPNYRRMLDREGAAGPEDVAVVGDEAEVERQLRALAGTGCTDLVASIFPAGEDAAGSVARTWSLLKGLVGKL
jgi:5,10-methylenetetrahydromethanopterin reductase